MSWIDFLEKRFERFAIPHLLRYVALLNGLAFVLSKLKPGFLNMLQLDASAVLHGEVWRLVSHIFVPSIGGLLPDWIGAGLYLLLLVWLGDGLEEAMGSFRTTLYYFVGLAGTAAAAFMADEGVGGIAPSAVMTARFRRATTASGTLAGATTANQVKATSLG